MKMLKTDLAPALSDDFLYMFLSLNNKYTQIAIGALNRQLSNTRALRFDDYFKIRSQRPAVHLIVDVNAYSSSHFTRACKPHITPNRSKKHPMQPHIQQVYLFNLHVGGCQKY
jgi:hypothetical protein